MGECPIRKEKRPVVSEFGKNEIHDKDAYDDWMTMLKSERDDAIQARESVLLSGEMRSARRLIPFFIRVSKKDRR